MPRDNLFCWPALGRSGLGNLLLPWARCELFARDHQARMLAPRWTHLKIGPILRRELDKRFYIGLFRSTGYIRGLRRYLLLKLAKQYAESDAESALAAAKADQRVIVRFAGMEGDFTPILGEHEFIRSRLYQILSKRIHRRLDAVKDDGEFIAVHIRRGDMRTIAFGEEFDTSTHGGLPLQWYINIINQLRQYSGKKYPVRVYSDGRDEELRPLLDLPDVVRSAIAPSIVDILRLARSRLIITGGGSTFSMWAVYLQQAPCIWYPRLREKYGKVAGHYSFTADLEGRLDTNDLNELVQKLK